MRTGKPPQIYRREFLKLLILAGGVVGCGKLATSEAPPGTPAPKLPATVSLDTRFTLENEAVGYGPNPAGCDRTTIRGVVKDSSGSVQPSLVIRLWAANPAAASTLPIDAQGQYTVDVAKVLSGETYHLQLVDATGSVLLSDVIVAQAIPDCTLNLLTVNFVQK
jgi:hypothetical protein